MTRAGLQKVRCVHKDGRVKFLMPAVINAGAAARNGFYPQPEKSEAPKKITDLPTEMKVSDSEELQMPEIADETIQKKKPGRKPTKKN